MNKNCFFRRGIGVLLSVLLTAACVPVAALGVKFYLCCLWITGFFC